MYNRYIPNGASYTRVLEDDGPPLSPPQAHPVPPPEPPPASESPPPEVPPIPEPPQAQKAPGGNAPKKKSGLSSLLKGLKLDDLDTGDLLLLLILLFLFLEGDDTELLITLGLLLVLGLE